MIARDKVTTARWSPAKITVLSEVLIDFRKITTSDYSQSSKVFKFNSVAFFLHLVLDGKWRRRSD